MEILFSCSWSKFVNVMFSNLHFINDLLYVGTLLYLNDINVLHIGFLYWLTGLVFSVSKIIITPRNGFIMF